MSRPRHSHLLHYTPLRSFRVRKHQDHTPPTGSGVSTKSKALSDRRTSSGVRLSPSRFRESTISCRLFTLRDSTPRTRREPRTCIYPSSPHLDRLCFSDFSPGRPGLGLTSTSVYTLHPGPTWTHPDVVGPSDDSKTRSHFI